MNNELKSLFLLDPEYHFLNHGSFGATPKPVFEAYQYWQLELEKQPVEFIVHRAAPLMEEARKKLGDYLNCRAEDIVYFPNPTTAINMVARSLELQPGDEILSTDHEYGAMDRTWRFMSQKTGSKYIHHPIPLPVTTPEDFVEHFWQGVNTRTKVIFISHITSPTALTFPVKEICTRARERGILSIVDGAHAPGHIPVDLQEIGADIYTGATHKWMCAPKGGAFLYARKEVQDWLAPLVVSWGYEAEAPSASQFIDYHEWQGTRELASFLAVPAAIDFQREHNWGKVQAYSHALSKKAREQINDLTGMPEICPDGSTWFMQMAAMQLPEVDSEIFKNRLYKEFKIEVPIIQWQRMLFLRVSFQAYNDEEDLQALINALEIMLAEK